LRPETHVLSFQVEKTEFHVQNYQ